MATLLIEHPITDYDTWHAAYSRMAGRRAAGGVQRERIMQPVADSHYVLVELEFAAVEEAQRFQHFLETQVWSDPAHSPAVQGRPQARVVDTAPVHVAQRSHE